MLPRHSSKRRRPWGAQGNLFATIGFAVAGSLWGCASTGHAPDAEERSSAVERAPSASSLPEAARPPENNDEDELPAFTPGSNPVAIEAPSPDVAPASELAITRPCRGRSKLEAEKGKPCLRRLCLEKIAGRLPPGTCVPLKGGWIGTLPGAVDPGTRCGPDDPVCGCVEILPLCD